VTNVNLKINLVKNGLVIEGYFYLKYWRRVPSFAQQRFSLGSQALFLSGEVQENLSL